jgi:hypothetical protein
MIGHHPWDVFITASHADSVFGNTSNGSVVSLAVDGIATGSVTGNTATGAQGSRGFGCSLAANYTAWDIGVAAVDGGYYPRWYHDGRCNP